MQKNDFVYISRTQNRIINAYGVCKKVANGIALVILDNGEKIAIDLSKTIYEVLI